MPPAPQAAWMPPAKQCQHDWFAGNQWFCFQHTLPSTRTSKRWEWADSNVPKACGLSAQLPCAGLWSASLCTALQLQQEVCSRRKSIAFPRTVLHTVLLHFGFFLSQDGGFRGCACCISHFKILKEISSVAPVMSLSQAYGAPSQAHDQWCWEQPWEQDSQRNILPWSLFSRAGTPCLTLHWHTTAQGVRKIPLSGKALDPASTRETFQRQLKWKKKRHFSLLVILATAAVATADSSFCTLKSF